MNILEVKDLHKYYDDIHAVNGISFNVKEGNFIAFLGPNGAGKSTTINIICTLLKETSGEVSVNGKTLGKDDISIRKDIGVVFQNNYLDRKLTVRENLLTRGSLYGFDKESLTKKVDKIISTLKINEFEDQYYGTLSGGQKRRTDIARALIHEPKILILDEPTTGLDPKTRKMVWSTLTELKKKGLTIFLTTHYMDETLNCDQVIILNKGEIVTMGTPEELRIKYSNDYLKLKGDVELISKELNLANVNYTIDRDIVIVKIKESVNAINLLNKLKDKITAFEMIRGTMDDVFLNLTGERLDD